MSEKRWGPRTPFLLRPTGKDYPWGGQRLNEEFAKKINLEPLAETWECSTHPDGASYIASGELRGTDLATAIAAHPEWLGTHAGSIQDGRHLQKGKAGPGLPILVKLINASQDLSVQVHPADEDPDVREHGETGKTEMWYVLDAPPGAHIIYGLSCDVSKEELRSSIAEGTIIKYLQKVPVRKNDVFFLEPGTIHAIGAGVLVAEVQQSSNLTYRLYDYDREDSWGNKRELHVDKALEVANLHGTSAPKQLLRVLRYKPGMASEIVSRCKYFEVHRMLVNTERHQQVWYSADELSYRVLLCIGGCGTMSFEKETLDICKGDCFFVPAESVKIRLHGKMQLLDVRS